MGESSPFLKGKWGDDSTEEGKKASLLTGDWRAERDQGSMHASSKRTKVHDVWSKEDPLDKSLKLTGHGVTVAVVDTGITPVAGLDGPGKIVDGPDLSYESQSAGTRYLDGYGHGTHMAGIIAGRDRAVEPGHEKDAKHFTGVAPDARLLNMKVAAADGGTDVTQVIAAIDWVVEHRTELGVRVLNLSYGTDSTQSSGVDPLALAVENAWRAGIVVVVAAGNDGDEGGTTLTMPAVDPYVIAVGSTDHHGSDKFDRTTVGAWTNPGTTRRPDLLAPGKSVVGLRVPGSYADRLHPEGKLTGDGTQRFFRGTGTSQSAAMVSGAAALLLQRNPALTPDQVKGLLTAGAAPLRHDRTRGSEANQLDLKRTLEILDRSPVSPYTQTWAPSTGTGSLDASRGSSAVVDPVNGVSLRGETDALGGRWDGPRWAALSTSGAAWSGGSWTGRQWSGDGWSGRQWSGDDWSGRQWSAAAWTGESWSGVAWSGRQWSGGTWTGRQWSGDDWSGRQWSGRQWSGRQWSGRQWSGDDWTGDR